MGQDLQYLYRLAGQFMASEGVRMNIHRLSRGPNRRFSHSQFAEKYYTSVNKGMRACKPETLGKIISYGMPVEPKEEIPQKAVPRALRPVGEVPRTPYLKMVPEADYFYFSDKSGFGYLAQLASQVVLAAMLDLTERHAAQLDAQKGVHVLDLTLQELAGWDNGIMTLDDIKPIFTAMTSRGQSIEACEAAWQEFLSVSKDYTINSTKLDFKKGVLKQDVQTVVQTTSLNLWREEYGK